MQQIITFSSVLRLNSILCVYMCVCGGGRSIDVLDFCYNLEEGKFI